MFGTFGELTVALGLLGIPVYIWSKQVGARTGSIRLIRSGFGLFLLFSAPKWVYCEYMLAEITQDGLGEFVGFGFQDIAVR